MVEPGDLLGDRPAVGVEQLIGAAEREGVAADRLQAVVEVSPGHAGAQVGRLHGARPATADDEDAVDREAVGDLGHQPVGGIAAAEGVAARHGDDLLAGELLVEQPADGGVVVGSSMGDLTGGGHAHPCWRFAW